MKKYTLAIAPRTPSGRREARRLRKGGNIPAILYGRGINPRALQIRQRDFLQLMRETQGSVAILTLKDDNANTCEAIIQDSSRNPLTDQFEHINFLALVEGRAISAHIQIHTVGEAMGVKVSGGLLEQAVHEVAVSCLPKDLPEAIKVDITQLDLGQTIHIKDLPALKDVTYTGNPEILLIACIEPAKSQPEEEGKEEGEGTEASPEEGSATTPDPSTAPESS